MRVGDGGGIGSGEVGSGGGVGGGNGVGGVGGGGGVGGDGVGSGGVAELGRVGVTSPCRVTGDAVRVTRRSRTRDDGAMCIG